MDRRGHVGALLRQRRQRWRPRSGQSREAWSVDGGACGVVALLSLAATPLAIQVQVVQPVLDPRLDMWVGCVTSFGDGALEAVAGMRRMSSVACPELPEVWIVGIRVLTSCDGAIGAILARILRPLPVDLVDLSSEVDRSCTAWHYGL